MKIAAILAVAAAVAAGLAACGVSAAKPAAHQPATTASSGAATQQAPAKASAKAYSGNYPCGRACEGLRLSAGRAHPGERSGGHGTRRHCGDRRVPATGARGSPGCRRRHRPAGHHLDPCWPRSCTAARRRSNVSSACCAGPPTSPNPLTRIRISRRLDHIVRSHKNAASSGHTRTRRQQRSG